jgi:hypothetical protein
MVAERPRAADAAAALGPQHPLTRACELLEALLRQAVVMLAVAAVGAIAVAQGRGFGVRLLSAALVVELALIALIVLVERVRRECVLRLIAAGREMLPIEQRSREARALVGEQQLASLAGWLERALAQAVRYEELAVTSRPPPGVPVLGQFEQEVNAIMTELSSSQVAVRGAALLELIRQAGYASAVYAGDETAPREQLWRVRHLLV